MSRRFLELGLILYFDPKFGHDKKLTAFNLFREYNSEEMVAHNEIAVRFMRENKDMDELTAISYRENIGDRKLIKELFINIFRVNFAQFELYIKTKQRRSPDFSNNFEAVVKEWNGFMGSF